VLNCFLCTVKHTTLNMLKTVILIGGPSKGITDVTSLAIVICDYDFSACFSFSGRGPSLVVLIYAMSVIMNS